MEKDTLEYYTDNIIGSDERVMRQNEFTINEQCASIICICKAPLELYNNVSTICECGRQYSMETVLHVEWAVNSNNDNNNTEIEQEM